MMGSLERVHALSWAPEAPEESMKEQLSELLSPWRPKPPTGLPVLI